MLELALYVVLFIGLSGLMAAIEAAVLNISAAEVEELRLHGAWGSAALKKITGRLTQPLVVLVVFTNTINVLGPMLAGRKAFQLYGDVGIGAIAIILTLGTIVFSEIVPKSLGSHYAPLVSRSAAPAIRSLIVALYPFVIALEWFSELLKTGKRRIGTEEQIRALARMGRGEGYIESAEGQMIHRAFMLNDRSAADIMTPLADVVAVAKATTIEEAASHVFRHAYSRYPIFGDSPDDVSGFVLGRDILEALTDGKAQELVSTVRRHILKVPPDMRSDELLVLFRKEHVHLAVVQDGTHTVGLVTLEDVLEELVGDIEDEKDERKDAGQ